MNSAMIVIGVMMLGEDHLLGESGEPGRVMSLERWGEVSKVLWW